MNKHKEARRRELLSAAREIINTKGYEECTVRSICQMVGVSPSSFYHCFEDKDEVLFELGGEIDDYFDGIQDQFNQSDARENLIKFMDAYFGWIERAGYECCWRIHIAQRHSGKRRYDAKPDRAVMRVLENILLQGRERWQDDIAPEDIQLLFMSTLQGVTFKWAQQEGSYSLTEYAKKFYPVYLRLIFK